MRTSQRASCVHIGFGLIAAIVLSIILGASAVSAQFGLPKLKVPKLPGQKQTKPKQPEKQGPAPEITAIDPDSGPPVAWERLR